MADLTPKHRPIVSFVVKHQMVQLYGAFQQGMVYTIFITHGNGTAPNSAARTVIKRRKCLPYIERGVIPNELRHNRPLHLG